MVIVLGEDLGRFRDASKELFGVLRAFVAAWGGRGERLGFDEVGGYFFVIDGVLTRQQVFLDVTEMIDYNVQLLNHNDLSNSFFQLDKTDPTVGFAFDAAMYCGPTYPPRSHFDNALADNRGTNSLSRRLILASHLANHIHTYLQEHKGYTSTVGISTSKLLAKLAGNVHKPCNQTTLIPPYTGPDSNVRRFLDTHDIGKIPGIGSKIARRIRNHVLGREVKRDIYEELPKDDHVRVGDVRSFSGMGPRLLDEILRGGGWHKDIGFKVWGLINGIDDSEVALARNVPTQVSIEDSFVGLANLEDVKGALMKLAKSLIRRMHVDLTQDESDGEDFTEGEPPSEGKKKWLAHPRTLRLATRPRLPPNPDGSRNYSSSRASRSCPMPQFIFSLSENIDFLAERLVKEALIPTFRKLHPDKSDWKLSLINIAATNMVDSAGDTQASAGRDISKMFRSQERVLREWKVKDQDVPPDQAPEGLSGPDIDIGDADEPDFTLSAVGTGYEEDGVSWESDDDAPMSSQPCGMCGAWIPHFALSAHEMYHSMPD